MSALFSRLIAREASRVTVRARIRSHMPLACLLVASSLALAPLSAQGGMRGGGMGGGRGGMGGRGGGMGGRGGGSGMKSPADAARKNLKESDQIAFYLDKKKPLALTHVQRDTLKSLRKEMQHMQEPLFKDMDKLASDGMSERGRGGDRGGDRGGARGGRGGRGDGGAGPGSDGGSGEPGGARGGRFGGVSDTVRALVARLTDIQDAYRDRAREKLTPTQRTMADSLFSAKLADERRKDEEAREKRRNSR